MEFETCNQLNSFAHFFLVASLFFLDQHKAKTGCLNHGYIIYTMNFFNQFIESLELLMKRTINNAKDEAYWVLFSVKLAQPRIHHHLPGSSTHLCGNAVIMVLGN